MADNLLYMRLCRTAFLGGTILVTACVPVPAPTAPAGGAGSGQVITLPADPDSTAPPGVPPGTCWDRTTAPAEIRTTTRSVAISPAEVSEDGIIRAPATFRNEDVTEILRPRTDSWFEIVCPAEMTPEFTASVQRALIARGYLTGPADGIPDERTSAAVAAYQAQGGYPGTGLSTDAARALGLIITPRPD
ncbi:peptidoglycan-binding domain-containing protein [uncultured Roseobacter sp.]|uniref:peptidoglycan-binding domain-containing protein n=1 Tax=uncultured Roseobacter sp. TaxID=114847 RepID=UPI00262F5111|nr:peptidoglycan-binding domain-containing protein [uncultured Roseobacter sp.]